MPLPHFLVVGAMKSGTTTLYRDLESHPGVRLVEKERSPLLHDTARQQYASELAGQKGLFGDISTHYTMRPNFDGAAARAERWLPPDTKIIYIVRDPVRRAVSHFLHWSTDARFDVPETVDEAVRAVQPLTDWGRYATQIRPWVEAFGVDNVRLVQFEHYVRDRPGEFASLCDWLGAARPPKPPESTVHNRSDGKLVLGDFWTRVLDSPAYEPVRRCLPDDVKQWAKRAVMRTAQRVEAELSDAAVGELIERGLTFLGT